jgi:hypothetical protein
VKRPDSKATVALTAFLAAGALFAESGCRSEGPGRYPVSGEVTYQGEPVPAGTILFAPDTSKGNDGPGTFVEFTDGHYQTPRGKGTVGGPHRVYIVGYTGTPDPSGESPRGLPLFPEYVTEADLPREEATVDFEIPRARRPSQ